jgi:hypothetical protein
LLLGEQEKLSGGGAEEGRCRRLTRELARRHFEGIWNQQNLGVADELMAQDYVEHAVAPFGQAEPGRANGPAATRQTVDWLRVEDGKLAEHWATLEDLSAMLQLGVVQPPGRPPSENLRPGRSFGLGGRVGSTCGGG